VINRHGQAARRACGFVITLAAGAPVALATAGPVHALVTINFDDQPGMTGSFEEGRPVPAQFLIDDEYAALGVRFTSAGGGIARSAPSNPVSPPNTVAATGPGPVLSYSHPVFATFRLGDTPAVVDRVSLALTNSSQPSALDAFDANGALLGTVTGGASATLTLTFDDQIHSIRIRQGPMAFDDFAFDGLQAVPEPGGCTAALGTVIALGACRRRCRHAAILLRA
jgi:hypothetical protein